MRTVFDTKVLALSKSPLTKIIRPIRFIHRISTEQNGVKFQVGNVTYVLEPGEGIPILFMGAFQVYDWIICLEKRIDTDTRPMIGGFYKGESHCNFGPIATDDVMGELFKFFEEQILK
jgi:hypothetical protein